MTGKDEKEKKKREKKGIALRLSAEMKMPFQKDGEKIKGDAAKEKASFGILDIGIVGDIALGLVEVLDGVQVELRNIKVMVDTRAQGKQPLLFLCQLVRVLILVAKVR